MAQCKLGPTYTKIIELASKIDKAAILTQNIDGLALQTKLPVIELHGNLRQQLCMKCGVTSALDYKKFQCKCGGKYRPDVVLFGQSLSKRNMLKIYIR